MFFKSLIKTLGSSYGTFYNTGIDNANPNIVNTLEMSMEQLEGCA